MCYKNLKKKKNLLYQKKKKKKGEKNNLNWKIQFIIKKSYPAKIPQRQAQQHQFSCWVVVFHKWSRQQRAQHPPGITGSSRMSFCFVLVHHVRSGTQRCRWTLTQSEISPSPLSHGQSQFPWSRSRWSWSTSVSLTNRQKPTTGYYHVC